MSEKANCPVQVKQVYKWHKIVKKKRLKKMSGIPRCSVYRGVRFLVVSVLSKQSLLTHHGEREFTTNMMTIF